MLKPLLSPLSPAQPWLNLPLLSFQSSSKLILALIPDTVAILRCHVFTLLFLPGLAELAMVRSQVLQCRVGPGAMHRYRETNEKEKKTERQSF